MEIELPSLHSPNKLIADAVKDHISDGAERYIRTWIDGRKDENYAASYFIRKLDEMPEYEKLAISLAKGNILDIGAGAGAHSRILASEGKNITAIENEPVFIELLKSAPSIKVVPDDFFKWETSEQFDTILLLMNGLGIAETVDRLSLMMDKVKKLKSEKGKILVEITDYLFSPEYDPEIMKNPQVMFRLRYNGNFSTELAWLYPTLLMVQDQCSRLELKCSIIYREEETFLLELS